MTISDRVSGFLLSFSARRVSSISFFHGVRSRFHHRRFCLRFPVSRPVKAGEFRGHCEKLPRVVLPEGVARLCYLLLGFPLEVEV